MEKRCSGFLHQAYQHWSLTSAQVGAFERDPKQIAECLAAWFGAENAEFKEMAKRAKAIGAVWQNALFRIVEDLAAMVQEDSGQSTVPKSLQSRSTSWELACAS